MLFEAPYFSRAALYGTYTSGDVFAVMRCLTNCERTLFIVTSITLCTFTHRRVTKGLALLHLHMAVALIPIPA